MQIICNNCGSELNFPNQQVIVTCPNCHTHLQIEETENTIIATIVDNPKIDNSIFENQKVATTEDLSAFYNLLFLENQYTKLMEENWFYSLLLLKKNRPILGRGVLRIIFGVFFGVMFLKNITEHSTEDFLVRAGLVVYGLFLIYIGIKEIFKWRRIWMFEKHYFEEQKYLIEQIEQLNLPKSLQQQFETYKRNQEVHLGNLKRLLYLKIGKYPFRIGTSGFSQGVRLIMVSIVLFVFILANIRSLILALLLTAIVIFIVFVGVKMFQKSTNMTNYNTALGKRQMIIRKLNDYFN